MVNSPAPINYQTDVPPLWKRLAGAFPHRHAIISEAELLTRPMKFDATESDLVDAIGWSKDQQLVVQAANEPGCLKLTPQGRRLWRELMGEI